jgi:alkylated DNA repair dioxygenase AlkB
MALEALDFQRAPLWVGEVRQDFDLVAIQPGLGRADTALAPLLALAESYAALLRAKALSLDEPSLADFVPTDIHVQRYGPGSAGISPHRDSRRFIKLISVFSLGNPAEFRVFRDRRGPPLRRYHLDSGDLLLLRAPGFAHRPSAGPLHSVSGPTDEVRYSITLRMKQPAAATAAS